MLTFELHNPTRLVFGRDTIARLGALVPKGSRVLLTHGGGSIFQNGVHSQVRKALEGFEVTEFGGIEPNPRYETLMKAVAQARREGIRFLLSVGGGSVLDGTKFIAAAVPFEGADPWSILETTGANVTTALPIGAVLTLPATGSEANGNAVVSRDATQEKLHFYSPLVYPLFSILDPVTTFTLDARQTGNGIVDAFVHTCEQYVTQHSDCPLQDRQAEAILSTLIEEGPKALARPNDYEARANLMWCATQALTGTIGAGVPGDWGTHGIGHELTAFYGIDHARTLAIVMPALWRHQLDRKGPRLASFGRRVLGLSGDDPTVALQAIDRTIAFFESLGLPTSLAAYGVEPASAATRIKERFQARGAKVGERGVLGPAEVEQILLDCA